ncbi:MAG: NYN domain-containing protein [Myxococcota bacterium]|nr:NYN domain-containing protein [Myxococcota bacterium]
MNVIGSRPKTRWWRDRNGAMRQLLEDLAPWGVQAESAGVEVLVVFDGYPISGLEDVRLSFEFAERPGPDGADDRIVELVQRHPDRTALVVVTSDRELRRRVRELGASVEGVGQFLAQAGSAARESCP